MITVTFIQLKKKKYAWKRDHAQHQHTMSHLPHFGCRAPLFIRTIPNSTAQLRTMIHTGAPSSSFKSRLIRRRQWHGAVIKRVSFLWNPITRNFGDGILRGTIGIIKNGIDSIHWLDAIKNKAQRTASHRNRNVSFSKESKWWDTFDINGNSSMKHSHRPKMRSNTPNECTHADGAVLGEKCVYK